MRIVKSLGLLLLAPLMLSTPAPSNAQIAVGISVHVGPPVLPVYVQPVCPAPGYIWTPGYWAYGEEGYYWVPGTWVMAPEPGLLWTPGYWGFAEGAYVWHGGYWGPHVGFYGGVNYGYGYTGVGFWGGEWRGREFVYNRSVTNVNVTVIHNYYNKTVIVNENHVSYNGGPRGIQARPSESERIAEHEHHFEARREQVEHEHAAHADRRQWASENHGRPAIAASGRPGAFHHDAVAAHNDRAAEHRADRSADRRDDRRSDRPDARRDDRASNVSSANRNTGRNDRPQNALNLDNGANRPSSSPSNNARQAKEVRSMPNNSSSRGPQGEARGNPHVDRAPAQHSNGSHESAPHSNNKPEHGKEKP